MTVMTSREFEDNVARAQEATAKGPVFVTDHGRTTHVLMTLAQFERLQGGRKLLPRPWHWMTKRLLHSIFRTTEATCQESRISPDVPSGYQCCF